MFFCLRTINHQFGSRFVACWQSLFVCVSSLVCVFVRFLVFMSLSLLSCLLYCSNVCFSVFFVCFFVLFFTSFFSLVLLFYCLCVCLCVCLQSYTFVLSFIRFLVYFFGFVYFMSFLSRVTMVTKRFLKGDFCPSLSHIFVS